MSGLRYRLYRNSNLSWLGEFPEHWQLAPLKRFGRFEAGAGFPDNEQGVEGEELPFFKVNALGKAGNDSVLVAPEDSISFETAKRLRAYVFPPRSIAFAKIGAALLLGRLRTLPVAACLDNNMMGFMVDPPNSMRFFLYAMSLVRFDLIANPGTVPSLNQSQIANVKLSVPPPPEQTAIAAFLDRETGKIDALVEEQKRLIGLLQEKRQAVISHTVTKGLDSDARMKDSGIEWLGEVPAHWDLKPLKYVVSLKSGGTPSKANSTYWDGTIPWASAKDLKVDRLSTTADQITDTAIGDGAASLIPAGSIIVLVRGMMLARAFPVCIATVPMAINQDLKALNGLGLDNGFLAWTLRGLEKETLSRLDEAGHGTKALRMEAWTSMHVPVPPVDEQHRIATHLEKETRGLDDLQAEAEHTIELLLERRVALISAAVTGKIDVRGRAEVEDAA
ncbi:restriction endonuclease subunit S [Rhizobium sp. BR 317]|uniref:restriction endonuclease subunit S n=1 Tax=Rhizobium sp. BR 317 TaxID=3040015 RepID=UPI0039BF60B3